MNHTKALDIQWVHRYRSKYKVLKIRQYLFVKRIMDLSLLILLLPFWLPLIGIISFILKLAYPKDPVFFIQQRTGKNGNRFSMYKFRTMVTNADEIKDRLKELNILKWPDFKIPNDPRITPIGRFLRKTSMDELPQIFNVLIGDMSLVGPRPTSFKAEMYTLWETERLEVTPGLTGLWQICDRGKSEFEDRSRLDIVYIQSRCLTMDIEILIRTIIAVFKQKGAL